jgi:hypothetical protein
MRAAKGRFRKGESGNPAGRPPGVGKAAQLRASIDQHVPDILAAVVREAKGGDVQAARLLLDRVLPPLKSVDLPVSLPLPPELAAQGRAVVEALAKAEITPDEAASVMQAIAAQARIVEVDELERRVAALEAQHGKA